MDKLKEALNKPQVFWIASVLTAAVALFCCFLGTSSVANQAKKGASNVDNHFTMAERVARVGEIHPGPDMLAGLDKNIEEQKVAVRDKWYAFYQEQQAEVFVWDEAELTADFVTAVKAIKPGGELEDGSQIDLYINKVHTWFPVLARRVVYGLQPGRSATPDDQPLVTWGEDKGGEDGEAVPAMVKKINDNHFKKWDARPSTLQILTAQEDFWVFKALCEIIIEANVEATGPHDTVVRSIESMNIAQAALKQFPKWKGQKRFGIVDKLEKTGTVKRTTMAAGNKAMTTDEALMHKRYIDDNGVGVSYKNLTKPADEPSKEYRMMPIEMTLLVDKSKMLQVLRAFANSKLPVEVTQVRFNPAMGAGGASLSLEGSGREQRYGRFVFQAIAYLIKDVDPIHLDMKPPPEPAEPVVASAAQGAGQ